jgi:hypothetical protein
MGPDGVWRRIRWDNVARLAALVALALLVVAWPRLGGRAPRLPPPTAVPVATAPPAVPQQSGGRSLRATRPRPAKRAPARRTERAKRPARAEQQRAPAPAKRPTLVVRPPAVAKRRGPPPPPTRPPPRGPPLARRATSPRADPAATEFGLP